MCEELKPCPFCGRDSSNIRFFIHKMFNPPRMVLQCGCGVFITCDAGEAAEYDGIQGNSADMQRMLADRWNRRIPNEK